MTDKPEPCCDCRQCDSPCTSEVGGCGSVPLQSIIYKSDGTQSQNTLEDEGKA